MKMAAGSNFLANFGFRKNDNISSDDDLTNRNQNNNDDDTKGRNLPNDNDDNENDSQEDNLLEEFVDLENEDGDFQVDIDEDDEDETPPDPNLPDPDKELITKMQNSIKSIRINGDDIPDDMDWNDKKKVSSLLTKFVQMGVQNAVGVMAMPMQAALDAQEKNFSKSLKNHGAISATRQRMEQAFSPIGESLRGDKVALAYAKEQFQKHFKKNRDPKAAAQATAKIMKGLGKVVNLNFRSQGNNNSYFQDDDSDNSQFSAGPARREGVAALDHFAPLPQRRQR
jgi:hypothetical protein